MPKDNDEMSETIVPRKSTQQEAAIYYSKNREGKIGKEALKRRLKKLYSSQGK